MKMNFTNCNNPQLANKKKSTFLGRWNFLSPSFFSLIIVLMFGSSAFAQIPSTCGPVNCTANDVKVSTVMITGKNGAPINCGAAQPFKDAELHLFFSSNAARMGVTLGATLVIPGASPHTISYCFSGQLLNDGTTELVYTLPESVAASLSCSGGSYSLTNIYVAWGTGATKDDDFCGLSYDAKCPANKAKCYYAPNQVISVPVLLAVSFTYTAGTCNAGTSLNVTFTPKVTLQNVTYPLTYVWNFGDPVDPDDPNNPNIVTLTQAQGDPVPTTSHIYSGAGTFNPSVTVTDANATTPVSASYSKEISLGSCCKVPTISEQPSGGNYCQFSTTELPLSVTATGTNLHYQWYSNSENSTEGGTPVGIDQSTYSPSTYEAGTTYYYVVVTGDCGTETSEVAAVTIQAAPNAGTSGTLTVCAGTTPTEEDLLKALKDNPDANGTWSGPVDGVYTYTVAAASPCTQNATSTVTVTEQAAPNAGTSGTLTVCAGTTLTPEMLFAQLGGTKDEGGTWTPALAGAGTYTYTVAATSPCTEDATSTVTVSVDPASAATISLTGSANACSGNNSGTINITSKTGNIVRWESSTDGTVFSTYALAGTSSSLNFTNITANTWFRVVVQNGSCPEAHSAAIKISIVPCVTTFTQGFWGGTSGSGKDCKQKTVQEILTGFQLPLNPIVVGSTDKYLKLNDATKVRAIMPGGSYSQNVFDKKYVLSSPASGEFVLSGSKFVDSKTGKLVSVVISQTIALALNIKYNSALGDIAFQSGKNILNTASLIYSTGSCTVASVSSPIQYTMSPKVLCYLRNNVQYTFDIKGLLSLANNVIGGNLPISSTGSPFSFSELVQTLDAINKGFDKGAQLVSYSGSYPCTITTTMLTIRNNTEPVELATVKALSVSAFPNPFTDKIRFTIQAPKAGRATLEVYNMLGQKVGIPFEGLLNAGETRNVEYTAPVNNRTNLIYMLRMNGEQISGKVMSIKQ